MPGPSSFSLLLLGIGAAFWLVALFARRMIRVGPGEDDEDEDDTGKKRIVKKPVVLDPKIVDYYPKPETAKSPT